MIVSLMINGDDVRTLNKSPTVLKQVNAELYDDCSIINPRLKVEWFENIANVNYMFIPDFRRFYFVKPITVTGGAAMIEGESDPLMSFINEIQDIPAICIRDSRLNQKGSVRSSWIEDPQLPLTYGRNLKVVEFEGSELNIDTATATSNNFIFNVAGGGAVTPGGE